MSDLRTLYTDSGEEVTLVRPATSTLLQEIEGRKFTAQELTRLAQENEIGGLIWVAEIRYDITGAASSRRREIVDLATLRAAGGWARIRETARSTFAALPRFPHPTETPEYWEREAAQERAFADSDRARRANVESVRIHEQNAENYEARARELRARGSK